LLLIVASAYLLRLTVQVLIYYKSAKKLTDTGLIWFLPLYDLLHNLYLIVFGFIGTFIKTTQWK